MTIAPPGARRYENRGIRAFSQMLHALHEGLDMFEASPVQMRRLPMQ